MGSCITYNFINKYHEFLGGGISPGMEMRLKSLNQFTAKLPLVKPDSNVPLDWLRYYYKYFKRSGAGNGKRDRWIY